MRHSYRKDCVNPDKAHLWRLPNLEEPPPKIDNPSNKGVLLIPLFESKPWHDGIVHHNGIGAVWARRSWLVNSDAQDHNIEVKFYIEDKMLDEAALIFRENHVKMGDILIFDGEPFDSNAWLKDETGPFTGESKKCSIFTNHDLRKYEWVFMADSDMFVVSSQGNKLPFFSQFFGEMPDDGLVSLSTTSNEFIHAMPPHQTVISNGWCRTADHRQTEEAYEAFKSKFAELVGDETTDVFHIVVHPESVRTHHTDAVNLIDLYFETDHWYITCQNGLMAFPSGRFMRDRWDDCQWLNNAAHTLLSDEFVFSLWHSRGRNLYEIKHHLDIESVMFTHSTDSLEDIGRYKRFVYEGRPFLFHYGSPLIEKTWREGIGAL